MNDLSSQHKPKYSLASFLILAIAAGVIVAIIFQPPRTLKQIRNVHVIAWVGGGEKGDFFEFQFKEAVTRKQTQQVLNLLPVGGQIRFYDSQKKYLDGGMLRGLTIHMRRISRDEFAVFNEPDWISLTKKEGYDYFWMCHMDNCRDHVSWPPRTMRLQIYSSPPETTNQPTDNLLNHIRQIAAKANEED